MLCFMRTCYCFKCPQRWWMRLLSPVRAFYNCLISNCSTLRHSPSSLENGLMCCQDFKEHWGFLGSQLLETLPDSQPCLHLHLTLGYGVACQGLHNDMLANRTELPFLFLSLPGGLKVSGVEAHLFCTRDWGQVAFVFAKI